ncbi:Uncharacterised protein [Achromobacter ruhlandii]|uniref:hypothetical protein n=1 Tax=Achromobacter ruhlandii TaxID=72557 RepID=UPI0006BFFEEF|nr:hypothetical protein [Achromobacter ruhlandii]CUJ29144.1 Uncharacterised protein [Achromobacter ruhlandii]
MADTNFFELFTVTWAQAGTVDVITDVQYKTGWTYIGSLPPTVEQFNKVQQLNDERMGWLYRQLAAVAALTGRPLSAAGDDAISFALQNLNASNLSAGTVPVARLAGTASSLTAGAATKLAVSRSFSVEGGATAAAQAFDGTGDVKLTVTGLDVGKANAGVLAVARGGTGLGAVAAGDYLVGTGGGALATKTPVQVLNHIGGAPLDSPGLTGTPTAPTPAATDRSTRIATTAFVAGNFPRLYSIAALPAQDVGPIIVIECAEVWTWSASQYFTGYRSPLCGRPLDGHTATPLASEVDAIGGLLSKVGYAPLWGYAQEQGLVKTEAVWQANRGAHWFTDYSATQFRVPDLRDMFRRFTGTDADTANARALANRQADSLRSHAHGTLVQRSGGAPGSAMPVVNDGNNQVPFNANGSDSRYTITSGAQTLTAGGSDTRPVNTAYAPRIHV